LNTELFIARKIFTGKENKKGISRRIVNIAVASITIGLAVMILSVSVLLGFKKEVREKVIGFGAHFQIVNYDANNSFETKPIRIDSLLIKQFDAIPRITKITQFATKPGIIKTNEAIHPLVLKGVDHTYDWDFFARNLTKGKIPFLHVQEQSNEVLISEKQAKLLRLDVDSALFCYFWNEGESTPRYRKFNISGIYKTSLGEFDELFVLGDIKQVTRLNGWQPNQASGYELFIDNFDYIETINNQLREVVLNNATEDSMLKVVSVNRKYSLIFDWLSLLDMNVWVLMILMIVVAGINMISGLLIIILERSRMIGILKALGYPYVRIRKIFLYLTAFLATRGLFWGNLLGLGICFFQYYTGLFKLDPVSYYIDTVPIHFNVIYILLLNLGTMVSILAMILIPSEYISKINPADSIAIE
jgi:lipoprotein-releasing system permease protein